MAFFAREIVQIKTTMISSQRKAHKFIWLGIVVIIPILLFFAIRDLEFSSPFAKNQLPQEELSVSLDRPLVKVHLHRPLKSPSVLVYELDSKGKRGAVLGQLQGVGTYTFSTAPKSKGILIFDEIKKEEHYKIEF